MKAKFQEFQFVEVDGTATGYGDIVGWITSVELSDILGVPYYHIRVYSGHTDTVYVAEKFVRETERSVKIEKLMNGNYVQNKKL
jgi:hypothetical protein